MNWFPDSQRQFNSELVLNAKGKQKVKRRTLENQELKSVYTGEYRPMRERNRHKPRSRNTEQNQG